MDPLNGETPSDIGTTANQIFQLIKDLDSDTRRRVVNAALVLCGDAGLASPGRVVSASPFVSSERDLSFVERDDLSPKEFMQGKAPKTDVEKIACLAYYLTHYRDTPHFKTLDLSKLNTEAAQLKFANAAQAAKNAARRGFLTAASKAGMKQLSAIGEEYVAGLPDRDVARKALARVSRRRPRAKRPSKRP